MRHNVVRRNAVRHRARAMLVAVVTCLAALLPGTPATAGTTSDYPEFPYPSTSYTEPFRGQFHFSPRGGWMNDPNGMVYANGVYHFFHQHNPHGLTWDTMHWGHATSTDMVHWTQKPIALEPGVQPGGPMWSGGGVVDSANTSGLKTGSLDPIVVFSNINGVSVYYSNDNGQTFQAYDNGNKVVQPPAPNSRDANVFWHAPTNRWVMAVWSDQGGNGISFYTSPNLLSWTFASRYQADWAYECPDLFPLPLDGNSAQQRWVLAVASGQYVVGDFNGTTFSTTWTGPQLLDQGVNNFDGTFYAPQTFKNVPGGRTVQMAWQSSNHGSVWTGNATFPVQLGLVTTPGGPRVTRTPIGEIASLRSGAQSWTNRTITPDPATDPFAGIQADTYEISAEFDLAGATATSFGFDLHRRANGTSDRSVVYDVAAQTLYGKPLAPQNNRVKLRLLVDRGQLEIFGNDGLLSVSDNVNFDSSAGSQGIRLFANGGSVQLVSAQFYRLGSAWGQGESTLNSNLDGPWHAVNGTWGDVTGGKSGSTGGDSFYLSSKTGTDAVYEGDLRLDTAQAAGLTFRSDADGSQQYTANIDQAGLVKLWRPGQDIGVHLTPIVQGRTYHLKVQTTGSRIRVYLDNGSSPVIDVTDTTYTSGLFGANVFSGNATVQNLNINAPGFTSIFTGRWTPAAGTWTVPLDGLRGSSPGDGFYLTDVTATDFNYEGDLRVTNGVATGLTFRSNADASQQYTANIDTNGLVKLWRPGHDIATFTTSIIEGRTYHLRVQATGSRFRVYFNNGATPVIDATDTTYASGVFGVNVFNGNASVRNLQIF
ncbi:glycoside hydrolase family 32 protein [Streptomyces sp.]|uniref:glycoside hydrolase family 32 protein n=1 Tax=Streptomyces sp. TaxID=1931 RepID=UPI002F4080B3